VPDRALSFLLANESLRVARAGVDGSRAGESAQENGVRFEAQAGVGNEEVLAFDGRASVGKSKGEFVRFGHECVVRDTT
jgi:hypothetical protein